jgi:hypothetical protein
VTGGADEAWAVELVCCVCEWLCGKGDFERLVCAPAFQYSKVPWRAATDAAIVIPNATIAAKLRRLIRTSLP